MPLRSLLALAVLLSSSTAMAHADLIVSVALPSGSHVYENGTYDVLVENVGNRNADSVSLTIALPETNTSPGPWIMGTVGSIDGRCSVQGNALECQLGRIRKRQDTTVSFDMSLPYSAAPLVFDVSVATPSREDSVTNNDVQATASPLTYDVAMALPFVATNEHCTGQGLSSFFECVISPGSITSHDTILNADGTIDFPGQGANYTGTWSQPAPNRLVFQYLDNGVPVANFDGYGVSASCFEGVTTFPGSAWMSMYSVCN